MSLYLVVEKSLLGHECCHKATVLFKGDIICECLEVEDANKIAKLLNENKGDSDE